MKVLRLSALYTCWLVGAWGCAQGEVLLEGHGGAHTAATSSSGGCDAQSFQCKSGECIDLVRACDHIGDCADNSDEAPKNLACSTRCRDDELRCQTGECVPLDLACDGFPDCLDGSDEAPLDPRCGDDFCGPGYFPCATGECIPWLYQCDGIVDCGDGSDEAPRDPNCGY